MGTINIFTKKIKPIHLIAILLFVIFVIMAFFVTTKKFKPTEKIVKVNTINVTINQGDTYILPKTTNAYYSSNSVKPVDIYFEDDKLDTNTPGIIQIKGAIKNYQNPVILSINIIPHKIYTTLSNTTVYNSLFQLSTSIPKENKFVKVEINKGGQSKTTIYLVEKDSIALNIYLPYGEGEYKLKFLLNSNLEIDSTYSIWKEITVVNMDKRDLTYILPSKYVESDALEIKSLSETLTSGLDTDIEKALAIHDYVATNIAFDVDSYFNNNIHNYSALETLKNKKALCTGYANLTAALCRASNIKTKVVGGMAYDSKSIFKRDKENHAWNQCLIDGKWINIDSTWDAGAINEDNQFVFILSHEYFNPNNDIFNESHSKDGEEY